VLLEALAGGSEREHFRSETVWYFCGESVGGEALKAVNS